MKTFIFGKTEITFRNPIVVKKHGITKRLNREIIEYLKVGRLLYATQLYKEATGKGLRESKNYIDNLRMQLNI